MFRTGVVESSGRDFFETESCHMHFCQCFSKAVEFCTTFISPHQSVQICSLKTMDDLIWCWQWTYFEMEFGLVDLQRSFLTNVSMVL